MERRSDNEKLKNQYKFSVPGAPRRKDMKSHMLSNVYGVGGWSGGGGGGGSGYVALKTDQTSVKDDEKKKKKLMDLEEGGTTEDFPERGKEEEKGSIVVDVWSKPESGATPSSDIDRRRVDKLPVLTKPQVSLFPSTLPPPPPLQPLSRSENDDPLQLQESSGTTIEDTVVALSQSNKRAKKWEILQCIVRCSLFESVTSLLLLTSAATSNISNGNIVALTLTNLITGLFIFRPYLMRILKKHKTKMGQRGAELEQMNWGNKVFKDIMHYFLPLTMIISSFLIFGMVPPLVYAFTFHNSDDKNLKLAATLGASLLCTSLLIILAMYLQKLKGWLVYVKSIFCCAFVVVFLFGLSYLLGYLFGILIEKLDWFE